LLIIVKDRVKAAELTLGVMMVPSVLGIVTDVFGIVFIAIAPIKTMINHAIFCGFWALASRLVSSSFPYCFPICRFPATSARLPETDMDTTRARASTKWRAVYCLAWPISPSGAGLG
jgi:hypothetical protein